MRISYNGYASIQKPTMLQDLMSSYDYARLYDKARVEYGLAPGSTSRETVKSMRSSETVQTLTTSLTPTGTTWLTAPDSSTRIM